MMMMAMTMEVMVELENPKFDRTVREMTKTLMLEIQYDDTLMVDNYIEKLIIDDR